MTLLALSLTVIYILFSEYREEEFQQRQNEKINYTIGLILEFEEMSEELSRIMDEQDIHDFYDEKMLIFDSQKDLIFSSIDDLPISSSSEILNQLSPSQRWVETKDGVYDLIGVYIENNGKSYYAVSKAYDEFGYTKLNYLRNVLIGLFIAIVIVVVAVSLFLSNKISGPITLLAENISDYDLNQENVRNLETRSSSYEIRYLTNRFNELLDRTQKAFAFQKHAIHHISHELKTPIAILVSELEKTNSLIGDENIRRALDDQIHKAKSLSEIINILLEIAKIESGRKLEKTEVRVDEIIFDIIEELNIINPEFKFDVQYVQNDVEDTALILFANKMLLRQAFLNLLNNCMTYASDLRAEIRINSTFDDTLTIAIGNQGRPVSEEEQKYLFYHFFRGENSHGKMGFGLGLVFTKKIIALSSGEITYSNPEKNFNIFEVIFRKKLSA